MIVKQYTVTLPADYDMQIIRKRIALKGPAFDDFPGLGVKVFMIRQKDRFGAESNQYAPVYLWPSVKPMWAFIAGEGFRGIVDSFGWTPIRYWLGLAYACAADIDWRALRSVTREEAMIQPGADLPALRARENHAARDAVAAGSGLVARAVGVDTDRWALVRYDYWTCEQSSLPAGAWSYEALHVSAPHPSDLVAM
jgi:hypothetical protein